ncbi:MAG: hypothetical protein Q7S66_02790 [bacterium]|nr:hypothetical protein [bacterium]
MRFRLIFSAVISICLVVVIQPLFVEAAGVGFVPDGRIWFSDDRPVVGESTRIYTVIINNDYYSLDAAVGFFVDGNLIDTAVINNLQKERAVQIRASWRPTEGAHTITVEFINASVADEAGNITGLNVQDFNTVSTSTPFLDPTPLINLQVEKNGDTFTIVELSDVPDNQKIISNSPFIELDKNWQAGVRQYAEITNKITSVMGMVTTSVETIKATYAEAKSWLDYGNKSLEQAKTTVVLPLTFIDKIKSFLQVLPSRNRLSLISRIIFFILLFYLVAWIIIKRSKRRDRY